MRPLIIIPTYNERDSLPKLITELRQVTQDASILIVDDNSPDGTGAVAQRLSTTDKKIYLLSRPKKEGLGRAYRDAFRWAINKNYDPICTMDADLSHNPRHLPELIAQTTKTDIGLGSRYIPGGKIIGWTWDRYLLSWIANFMTRFFLRLKVRDVTAGYKCYRRNFLSQLSLDQLVSPGYAFQAEMILLARDAGASIQEIPITFHDRTIGRSKVSRHELYTSAKSLILLATHQRGLREAIKFGLVGGFNFIIDVGITNLLVILAHWSPIYAGYFGTTIALGTSFILNRGWTFRAGQDKLARQASKFLLINGIGAAINAAAYTFLIRQFGIWYNLAKLLAILGSGLWNFLMSKYWVFRSPGAQLSNTEQTITMGQKSAK